MLSIISPAKKLMATPRPHHEKSSNLDFQTKSLELVKKIKTMSVADISSLMNLSENLSRLNFERYQDFNLDGSEQQPSANALFLFQGDVYQSLDAASFKEQDIEFAQTHLNILSGLYGLIKPLDLIQPYRLEMGTKLEINNCKNLYEYWQHTLTKAINNRLSKHQNQFLLNLASSEYFKAISIKKLLYPMINVHFKEDKNGQLKTIGIHAKKARGAMARFIIINKADTLNDVLAFNELDYKYQPNISNESNIVFTR